jgi:hypothetical protein
MLITYNSSSQSSVHYWRMFFKDENVLSDSMRFGRNSNYLIFARFTSPRFHQLLNLADHSALLKYRQGRNSLKVQTQGSYPRRKMNLSKYSAAIYLIKCVVYQQIYKKIFTIQKWQKYLQVFTASTIFSWTYFTLHHRKLLHQNLQLLAGK